VRRRAFLTWMGGVVAWPLAARAQSARVATIGVLVQGVPAPAPFLRALRDGLRDAGYVEGQNIRLEIRSAEGRADLLPERAADLVRLNVDLIVAFQTPAVIAAKTATSQIPIVMAPAGDPLSTGLVASLARPGGNITGVSGASGEIGAKTVELLRELLPSVRSVAVLANETDPFTKPFLAEIGRAAQNLDMAVDTVLIRPGQPADAAIESMVARRADAMIVQGSLARREVFDLALKHRLPSCSSNQLIATLGGLMAYGASQEVLYRQAVPYIDRILKGAKPGDLPVEQPTRFELIINLKTAAALGLTVPLSLLARADEVIE
jgi:putative ABC transport system substrate-binding protein